MINIKKYQIFKSAYIMARNIYSKVDRMNNVSPSPFVNKSLFMLLMLGGVVSHTSADEALSSSIDCSNVSINFADNPEWTRSERIGAMDKAFFDSVNRFELCNLSNQSSASSTSSVGSGGHGEGTESSGSEGEANLDSTASSEMSGTEEESVAASAPTDISETPENSTKPPVTAGSGANGGIPEDIPAADNDDVIAAQIRLAAEIEQDPVKKEKLWNEYRKYKGLPVNE